MKIAMLVANRVASDPRVIREADILHAAGHELRFFGIDYGNSAPAYSSIPGEIILAQVAGMTRIGGSLAKSSQEKKRKSIGFEVFRKCFRGVFAASQFRAAVKALDQHLSDILDFAPDVIHAHDLNALPTAVGAAAKYGGIVVYDSHELFTEMGNYDVFYKAYLSRIERSALKKVHSVITVSSSVAEWLRNKYKHERIFLFRNIPAGTPRSPRPLNEPISFLYHGMLSPNRGIGEIVQAFSLIPSDLRWQLIIRGFGPLLGALRDQVSSLGLKDRVILKDPISPEKVVSEAASEDVGIIAFQPSSLNNMFALPNKYFEYLLAGLCILTNEKLPELKRTVASHQSGYVFSDSSPTAISAKVSDLLRDPSRIFEAKRNSYLVAKQECNFIKEAECLLSVYDLFKPVTLG